MLCFDISGEYFFRFHPKQKTNWQSFSHCINSCNKKSFSLDGVSFSEGNIAYNLQGSRQYYEFICYMSCKDQSKITKDTPLPPQLKCYEDALNEIEKYL